MRLTYPFAGLRNLSIVLRRPESCKPPEPEKFDICEVPEAFRDVIYWTAHQLDARLRAHAPAVRPAIAGPSVINAGNVHAVCDAAWKPTGCSWGPAYRATYSSYDVHGVVKQEILA